LSSKTLAEQQKLLRKSSIRNSMKRVQKDTASLIDQPDSVSVLTSGSGKDSRLSRLFDFDGELLASQPYSQMIWKTVKLSFPSQDRKTCQRLSSIDTETVDIGEKPDLSRENITKDVKWKHGRGKNTTKDVKWKPGRRKVLLLGRPQAILSRVKTAKSFLGAGEASKTTFLKQMQHIYPNDALSVDRQAWRCIILDNLASAFQGFLDLLETHDHRFVSRPQYIRF
jgi:hypothetical protein